MAFPASATGLPEPRTSFPSSVQPHAHSEERLQSHQPRGIGASHPQAKHTLLKYITSPALFATTRREFTGTLRKAIKRPVIGHL